MYSFKASDSFQYEQLEIYLFQCTNLQDDKPQRKEMSSSVWNYWMGCWTEKPLSLLAPGTAFEFDDLFIAD